MNTHDKIKDFIENGGGDLVIDEVWLSVVSFGSTFVYGINKEMNLMKMDNSKQVQTFPDRMVDGEVIKGRTIQYSDMLYQEDERVHYELSKKTLEKILTEMIDCGLKVARGLNYTQARELCENIDEGGLWYSEDEKVCLELVNSGLGCISYRINGEASEKAYNNGQYFYKLLVKEVDLAIEEVKLKSEHVPVTEFDFETYKGDLP